MKEAKYPRIHLAVDNCFAIKRWVHPKDWMKVIHDIGNISCIQASTDNEIDPLFNTTDFRNRWVKQVRKYEKEYGLKVVSFYSGYATYRTVGLASSDKSSREKLKNDYFKNIVDVASKLGAQVGNTLSAFSEPVLNDPSLFKQTEEYLEDNLTDMAEYAAQKNVLFGYEQMYTPNQGFWTINGSRKWMKKIYTKVKRPMYITIDTAHQVGQRRFFKPTDEELSEMVRLGDTQGFRLRETLTCMVESKKYDMEAIKQKMDEYEYLFAEPADTDVYQWFSSLGCYSPLVHLQQTDGTFSSHKPFTSQYNKTGIIKPDKVLSAIANSYKREAQEGMPPRVKDIYLAFEIFFGITESAKDILAAIKESIEYWRSFIPQDGMEINELI